MDHILNIFAGLVFLTAMVIMFHFVDRDRSTISGLLIDIVLRILFIVTFAIVSWMIGNLFGNSVGL